MKKKRDNGCLGKGKKYTINGETMTIPEFARKYNIPAATLRGRIKKGYDDRYIFLSRAEIKLKKTPQEQRNKSCSWTQSALDCYDIGGDCTKCLLPEDIKEICSMRETIKEIVRLFGKPYGRNNFLEE